MEKSRPGGKTIDVITKVATEPPTPGMPLDKENAFMLYATFCGDVERTAHALNIKPAEVIDLATGGGWNEKLRGILELKRTGKAGDVERAINRALNFVQAHRYRLFLERVLQHIFNMGSVELEELFMSVHFQDKGTVKKFSTRPLADLASALEKCHVLTYMALGDSSSERRGREDDADSTTSGGELHAQIAKAMAGGRDTAAQLLAGQKNQAKNLGCQTPSDP